MHACFDVLRLISAAWYTSQYVIRSYLYHMSLLSPRRVVQHDDINASRHGQSVMRPECSNDHKGSDPSGITSSTVRKETDFV